MPSLPPAYFDALYARDADPWGFASSAYEQAKYDATLAVLGPRYASALEVGCAIGVLTARLAARCDALVAIDASETALAAARARCAALPQVALRRAVVPGDWPEGRFDLILLSEVLYYLDTADLARLAARVAASLAPGGDLLLVHWTGETDYPQTGDAAAEGLIAALAPRTRPRHQARHPRYRLDLLRRAGSACPPTGKAPFRSA